MRQRGACLGSVVRVRVKIRGRVRVRGRVRAAARRLLGVSG